MTYLEAAITLSIAADEAHPARQLRGLLTKAWRTRSLTLIDADFNIHPSVSPPTFPGARRRGGCGHRGSTGEHLRPLGTNEALDHRKTSPKAREIGCLNVRHGRVGRNRNILSCL